MRIPLKIGRSVAITTPVQLDNKEGGGAATIAAAPFLKAFSVFPGVPLIRFDARQLRSMSAGSLVAHTADASNHELNHAFGIDRLKQLPMFLFSQQRINARHALLPKESDHV